MGLLVVLQYLVAARIASYISRHFAKAGKPGPARVGFVIESLICLYPAAVNAIALLRVAGSGSGSVGPEEAAVVASTPAIFLTIWACDFLVLGRLLRAGDTIGRPPRRGREWVVAGVGVAASSIAGLAAYTWAT